MSTDVQPTAADRQRERAARRQAGGSRPASSSAGKVGPPRQRRPALAALAVALIVGGALVAGLLAVRLDSREPVYAAAGDIDAGQLITEAEIRAVPVSADGVEVIPEDQVAAIVNGGVYARVPIAAGTLLNPGMLTTDQPTLDGRAVVAVPLVEDLTPATELRSGDLVQVVRISGGEQPPAVLTEARVLSVSAGATDGELAASTGSVTVVVPEAAALVVVDAAGTERAGLALLRRGVPSDVELRTGDLEPVPGVSGGLDEGDGGS